MSRTDDPLMSRLRRRGAALVLTAVLAWPAIAQEGAPAPAAATAQPAAPTWKYVVGPGDVLAVSIRAGVGEATDLNLTVAGDGTIDVPHVGRLKVGGLTTQEVGNSIERRLRDGGFYKSPDVAVNVEEYLSQCVNVSGFVREPGRFCLTRETRIMDILSQAKGVLELEAADTLRIIRKGEPEPIRVSRSVLVGSDLEAARAANIIVLADDNIYVPAKSQFCILGPVKKPGCFPVEDGMTVLQAIAIAEGLDITADRQDVTIRRSARAGGMVLTIDLDALPPGEAPIVQADDQIVVAAKLITQFCISGAVKTADCPEFDGEMTLGEAIAKAGGLDETKADQKQIKVIRKIGEQRQTSVIDLRDGGPQAAGFIIKSGDEILVPEIPMVVWVSGAVKTEGAVAWVRGMTLSDALAAAGAAGAGDAMGYAKMSQVILRREGQAPRTIDCKKIQRGKADDMLLQPGDRINVPRKSF